jgi:hypothetical protein
MSDWSNGIVSVQNERKFGPCIAQCRRRGREKKNVAEETFV